MRFIKLLNTEIRLHLQSSALYTAGIMLAWTVLSLRNPYTLFLFMGGMLLASNSFNDIGNPVRAVRSLTLPCTPFEKWLCKWFITSIGFALYLLVLYYITGFIHLALNETILGSQNYFVYPTLKELGEMMLLFLPMHAIIMLGASYFDRYVLVKTGIILLLLFFVVLKLLLAFGFEAVTMLFQHMTLTIEQKDQFLWVSLGVIWLIMTLSVYALSFYVYKNSEIQ